MMKQTGILAACYLLGSIPFPYLLTRIKTGKDIREMGSGNVGATNVMRSAGKAIGLLVLVLDLGKGVAAVLLGRHYSGGNTLSAMAGFAAILGHSYPVFLRFRGGKSVATGAGAFLVLCPWGILSSLGVFGIMLFLFRIVSLSSMFASAAFPFFAWLYGVDPGVVLWGGLSAGLIVFRHKPNILRLIAGSEKRLGVPKNA